MLSTHFCRLRESNLNRVLTIASIAICTAGCGTLSKNVVPASVADQTFESYDCARLVEEARSRQVWAKRVAGVLDEKTSGSVAHALTWVAFALISGGSLGAPAPNGVPWTDTRQQEAEYARLLGEYSAIERVAMSKQCNLFPDTISK